MRYIDRCRCASALAGLATLLASVVIAGRLPAQEPVPLRVMSFNIRFGTADDEQNSWQHRREFVIDTIRAFDPDILGTQETLGFQRDYLAAQLSDYEVLGVGRDDGQDRGEMMALYYRRERFDRLDAGHFWLSESPEVIGSKSWDSSLPRMATWVKLRDRRQPDLQPIFFVNTHFDHRGPQARLESARLVKRKIEELGKGCAWILTGDFNAGEHSEPYQALFGSGQPVDWPLIDSYRSVHHAAVNGASEGTFNGFDVRAINGARIDWIGVSRDWRVEQAAIDRTERDGRVPSDHFPVTAILSR
jgi:endonuclease/exonuclease/phosphatase family metal-dependent hydrolase